MSKFQNVMETVFKAEHSGKETYLHLNKTEATYTFMGIYPYSKLKSSYLITKAVEEFGNIKKASVVLSENQSLIDEVMEWYRHNFWIPMQLDKVDSELKCKEIMVFVINVGIGRRVSIIKAIQRIVGVRADGIFGKQTIAAINSFDDDVFSKKWDEYEIRFYRRLVRINPRLEWALRGWENRARLV